MQNQPTTKPRAQDGETASAPRETTHPAEPVKKAHESQGPREPLSPREAELAAHATDSKEGLLHNQLGPIRSSARWEIVHQLWRLQIRLFPYGTRRRNICRAIGARFGRLLVKGIAKPPTEEAAYRLWIQRNETKPEHLEKMAQAAKKWAYRPVISIVVPVYQTPQELLRETIESVCNQIYDRWELCLADDGSERPEITQLLKEYASKDARIRFTQLPRASGISEATNAAALLADGEFIAFLNQGDTLSPDALYRMAGLLQKHRDADLIYSDEDKLGSTGERSAPFFKPDWSPDLFLSMNYVCHFLTVRRELFEKVGKLRSEFDSSQDYDLVLRVADQTKQIHHIPRVLYHWRASPSSGSQSASQRPIVHLQDRRAIADYLQRNSIRGEVEPGANTKTWRVRYGILGSPKVSIIMPTGGRLDMLRPCLESVFARTQYPNYEIFLVDNSRGSEVKDYVRGTKQQWNTLRYLDRRGRPFNFSALNNDAVQQVDAPLILFLNDDMTVGNSEWLTAMVEHGQRPGVGAVGAKLLYPSGTIQHAGVVMGVHESAGHAFRGLPSDSRRQFSFAQVIRDCSAVTAACLLTRRKVFLEFKGFDAKNLAVAYQDIDYCLRLSQAGYLVVYTPHAVLLHHESVTKKNRNPHNREIRYLQTTWKNVIDRDPYYSPNLTRRYENYMIRLE